jgi:hypothetical protein
MCKYIATDGEIYDSGAARLSYMLLSRAFCAAATMSVRYGGRNMNELISLRGTVLHIWARCDSIHRTCWIEASRDISCGENAVRQRGQQHYWVRGTIELEGTLVSSTIGKVDQTHQDTDRRLTEETVDPWPTAAAAAAPARRIDCALSPHLHQGACHMSPLPLQLVLKMHAHLRDRDLRTSFKFSAYVGHMPF